MERLSDSGFYIDSHAHIHMDYFKKDREEVYLRAREKGVSTILTVGIDLTDSIRAMEFASSHDGVYFACGFHPHDATKLKDDDLLEIEKLCENKKNLAIGEIGLDFYRNYSPRDVQIRAFELQLDLALRLKKPVILHVRDAHDEVISILSNYRGLAGIVHCFSGNSEHLEKYVDMGFYISFAGNVTYNSNLQDVLKLTPLDRLLFETDCPFLTPISKKGRRNEPSFVIDVYEYCADLLGLDLDFLKKSVFSNFLNLFSLTV